MRKRKLTEPGLSHRSVDKSLIPFVSQSLLYRSMLSLSPPGRHQPLPPPPQVSRTQNTIHREFTLTEGTPTSSDPTQARRRKGGRVRSLLRVQSPGLSPNSLESLS